MPSTALFLMPFILPLLYLTYRRLGAALPFSCVGFYGLISLTVNYDILTVVYFVFLGFALAGAIAAAQLKPYLLCMTVAAVFAIIGAGVGFGIVRLAEGVPLGDVASEYVCAENDDPFIRFLARNHYESIEIPQEIGRVQPDEAGYDEAVTDFYSDYVKKEIGSYAPYICVHYAGLLGLLTYFISVAAGVRTASPYDIDITEKEIALSSRCMGGIRREVVPISGMRFPRTYLWAVLLPAIVASALLDFVGGYDALSATIMHAFITLPTAAAFVALGAYFASLFGGRGKIVAYVVFYIVCAAMVVFPLALFICSIIGLCDIILNLRFWTEFIRDD